MTDLLCSSCRLPSASLKKGYHCGLCKAVLCRECVQFRDEEAFVYQKVVEEELMHDSYCGSCYDLIVAPAIETYVEILIRAKQVYIFTKKNKRIPLIRRSNHKLSHQDCPDKQEVLLHLAFAAAADSFNALVDVELVSTKIRNGGHQKLHWAATAYPAQINPSRLESEYPI